MTTQELKELADLCTRADESVLISKRLLRWVLAELNGRTK